MAPLRSFHERFQIEVGLDESKRRFVNRAMNYFNSDLFGEHYDFFQVQRLCRAIADALGEQFYRTSWPAKPDVSKYIKGEFYRCVQALEVVYEKMPSTQHKGVMTEFIHRVLSQSEVDLGIRWDHGRFIRAGAELLDEHLVNDPLNWLRDDSSLRAVLTPFEKGLSHFLQGQKDPGLLEDATANMYQALEALAHIVTERKEKDLSANRELFLRQVGASEAYKPILKGYIDYANKMGRHARRGEPKPKLLTAEVESFIYLTGLFIRMSILARRPQPSATPPEMR